jgi:hypothetical protein
VVLTQHINYLELLAVFLAICMFANKETRITIHIQMDNISAMTQINRRGGTYSASLTNLAKECWTWDRQITLCAEHKPGVIADEVYRAQADHWDWKLNPEIFSRRPDPLAETDAIQQMRPNPNFNCQPITDANSWIFVEDENTTFKVGSNSTNLDNTIFLPSPPDSSDRPSQTNSSDRIDSSADPQHTTAIQRTQNPIGLMTFIRNSYKAGKLLEEATDMHHGVQNLSPATTHSFTSGKAGVSNGIEIPFLDL